MLSSFSLGCMCVKKVKKAMVKKHTGLLLSDEANKMKFLSYL